MIKSLTKSQRIASFILMGVSALIALLVLISIFIVSAKKIIISPTDLGQPYAELYTEEQLTSRLSEDMTVFDGKLYVGGGDYDKNTGPVYVMSYDLSKRRWERSGEAVPDEQIKRFRVLGGSLVITGTDPKETWEKGNFYRLDKGKWETMRELPGGIHCFDAIQFGGKTFFGLGTQSTSYPIVIFDGETYEPAGFYKGGELLDLSSHEIIRVFNLFVFKGELYAFLTLDGKDDLEGINYMDLYHYNGRFFEFSHGSLPAEDMPDVVSTNAFAYFIMNDSLLVTSDLISFSIVGFGEGVTVDDIIEENGTVYVLVHKKSKLKKFESMIFEVSPFGSQKILGFLTNIPAGSFCKHENSFFFSLGTREVHTAADAGRVIRVRVK